MTTFKNWSGLFDGTYNYYVKATDLVGQTGSTEVRNITIDTVSPGIISQYLANDSYAAQSYIDTNVSVLEQNPDIILWNLYNNTGLISQANDTMFILNNESLLFYMNFDNNTNDLISGNFGSPSGATNYAVGGVDDTGYATGVSPSVIETTGLNINIGTNEYTMSSWFKSNGTGIVNPISLSGGTSIDLVVADKTVLASSYDLVGFEISSIHIKYVATTIYDNAWHMLTGVKKNYVNGTSELKVYVDGFLVTTEHPAISSTAPIFTTSSVDVGNETRADTLSIVFGDYFSEDEARLYNYAMTSDEVYNLYNKEILNNYYGKLYDKNNRFANLTDGTYLYNATIIDKTGKSNITSTNYIILDTTVPVISFELPTENSDVYKSQNYITINITFNETNFANVSFILVNNTMQSYFNKQYNYTFAGLSDGFYKYYVNVSDMAGNIGSTEIRNITLDTTNPTIQFVANTQPNNSIVLQPDGPSTSKIIVNVSYVEKNPATLKFSLFNSSGTVSTVAVAPTTTTWTFGGLADGVYWYNVSIIDEVNKTNTTGIRYITLDYTPPIVSYNENVTTPEGYQNFTYVYVKVNYSDLSYTNHTYYMYRNGILNSTIESPNGYNYTGLDDAVWKFNATVRDFVGYETTSSIKTWIVDTTTPEVGYANPTLENNTLTSKDYIYVNLSVNETNFNYTIFYLDGNPTILYSIFYNYTNLSDGIYFFNAEVVDKVGNYASTEVRYVTLDITPPTIENATDDSSGTFPEINDTLSMNIGVYDLHNVNYCKLLLNDTGTWENKSLQFVGQQNSIINFNYTITSLSKANMSHLGWKVWCNDSVGNSIEGNIKKFDVVDITEPLIITNSININTTTGTTILTSNFYNLTYNVTWSDLNLFQASVNVSCVDSGTIYYWEGLDINVTNYTRAETISLNGYNPQKCNMTFGGSDDHTKKLIKDYKKNLNKRKFITTITAKEKKTKKNKAKKVKGKGKSPVVNIPIPRNIEVEGVEFDTEEKNKVSIYSKEPKEKVKKIKTKKKFDRENFGFEFTDAQNVREFRVEADHKI